MRKTIESCVEGWAAPTATRTTVYRYRTRNNAEYGLRHAEPIAKQDLLVRYCLECGYWHHVLAGEEREL